MPKTQNTTVMKWLYIFFIIVAFLILFGGFVRLTRSGLSIVEWNPVSGVMPPIGEKAWLTEFIKYQETPEYRLVNTGMTLEEYKYIFYIEWIHRFIARLAGLFFAIPVFYFFIRNRIPKSERAIYVLMGLLFIGQAIMGWIMVASGLVDRPSVSHFRLTLHLLLALSLFGLTLWTATGHRYGFPDTGKQAAWSNVSRLVLLATFILLIQISYGGLTAGLKAGYVSNTWPLMLGKLIPPNLFNSVDQVINNPQTVVFIHRWFALLGLITVPYIYFRARKENYPKEILNGLLGTLGVVTLQITLGVLTVISHVHIVIALIHQVTAVALFGLGIFLLHRLRDRDRITSGDF